MECRAYTESLTALMDGELTLEERDQIKSHLDACKTCNDEYQSLFYSYNLVNAVKQLDFSSESWQAIEERIQVPARASWWPTLFPSFWIPAASIGALVLVVGSLFWFLPQQSRSDEMQQALQSYMQQREQDLRLKGVLVQDGSGGARMHFIQYNPFRDPNRRQGGNPFKAE